jgi:predicted metalloprotease
VTFRRDGQPYENAQLVFYTGGVNTACGAASSAVGPFYCPGDQRVYLDLSFYRQMQQKLGAGGDFAWAYVIAHEMGHHVQQQTGTNEQVRRLQQQNPDQANQLSARQELQADCYAGVWAHTVFQEGALDEDDLQEAFTASEAVGDDRLQGFRGGTIDPDSFTHGSSAQRRSWFNRGYESGEAGACDTYSPDEV